MKEYDVLQHLTIAHTLKSIMENRPFSTGSLVTANLFWRVREFSIIDISHSITADLIARKQSRTHPNYYKGHNLRS